MDFSQMSSAHFIFIPAVLLVGVDPGQPRRRGRLRRRDEAPRRAGSPEGELSAGDREMRREFRKPDSHL